MSNKSVSFGGVFHFPTPPKPTKDVSILSSKDPATKDVTPQKGGSIVASNKKDVPESKTVSVKNRFNCGSLRNSLKMVSSQGSTLIAIRLVRSKLRKREDTLPTTTTATPTSTTTAVTTTPSINHNNNNNNNVIQHSNNHILTNGNIQHNNNQQQQNDTTTTDSLAPPFLWVYHTNGTSTTNSSQYTLYNNDQDTLVHNLQCEEVRECKGFRKNLRGKWRRLVKKKPQQEVYTIPAELRDQLKQIYVY